MKQGDKKNQGFSSLSTGQIIDDEFILHEKIKWYTREINTQLWTAFSISKDNTLCIIKFYSDFTKEQNKENKDSNEVEEARLLTRKDLKIAQSIINAEKVQEQLIANNYNEHTAITLIKTIAYELPQAPKEPDFNEIDTDSVNEVVYKKYMNKPLFALFETPLGVQINQYCTVNQCKEFLQQIAQGTLSILESCQNQEMFYKNIHQDNYFIDISNRKVHMANMANNQLIKQIFKAKGEEIDDNKIQDILLNDMKDLGVMLVWMAMKGEVKDTGFLTNIKTSLELFKHINKEEKVAQYIDMNLGVDRNFSQSPSDQLLKNSFYDFIMSLLGNFLNKLNSHQPFESIQAALAHPFITTNFDSTITPSDI